MGLSALTLTAGAISSATTYALPILMPEHCSQLEGNLMTAGFLLSYGGLSTILGKML